MTERISFEIMYAVFLWDVIDIAERKGSLDSEIRNEEPTGAPQLSKHKLFSATDKNLIKFCKKFYQKIFHLPIRSFAFIESSVYAEFEV